MAEGEGAGGTLPTSGYYDPDVFGKQRDRIVKAC